MSETAESALAFEDLLSIPDVSLSKARLMGIVPDVHRQDFIFRFVGRNFPNDPTGALARYYDIGAYCAKLTLDFVNEATRVKEFLDETWRPRRLLDFASGYGCVARHLPVVFPDMEIATCDIHEEATAFNSQKLGLKSYLSSPTPELMNLPQQDVVIALSFFSHMPNATYKRWLRALTEKLSPGGVLIFTANGHVAEAKGTTGVKADGSGFCFEPRSEQRDLPGNQYGITISRAPWVLRALEQIPELRLSRFQEGYWWAIQDTYVCVRLG